MVPRQCKSCWQMHDGYVCWRCTPRKPAIQKPRNCIDCTARFDPPGTTSKRCPPCQRAEVLRQKRAYYEAHREEQAAYYREYWKRQNLRKPTAYE